jgi:hypothetical protein
LRPAARIFAAKPTGTETPVPLGVLALIPAAKIFPAIPLTGFALGVVTLGGASIAFP